MVFGANQPFGEGEEWAWGGSKGGRKEGRKVYIW